MTKYIIRSKFKDFLGNHEYISYTSKPDEDNPELNRTIKFSRERAWVFDTRRQATEFLDETMEIEEVETNDY